ncbi:MAG: serine/threonine protein kinase [Myxococcales bacterium]|nr:serine/threonine protein kinase [Myxococcales bacterium]
MGSSPDEDRTVNDRPTVELTDEHATQAAPAAFAQATPEPSLVVKERSLVPLRTPTPLTGTITTAAEALRGEEVERTRTFIKLGWAATVVGLLTIPFVQSTRMMTIAFVCALALGVVVSLGFFIAFRDPQRYTPRALFVLGVMCVINTHVAILFFGMFTLTSVLMVLGLHFIGRSELGVRRAVYIASVICHAVISLALISGFIPVDPGVFATDRPIGVESYVIGMLFTQGAFALAYFTGESQRQVSLRSIEQLQRTTRVAAQRSALLDELRADLARAQQGGAGRYTDHVFAGFRLGQVIGRGAHGEVYEAVSDKVRESVAVKLLHRELLLDPTQVARFLREARVMGSLDSPNVVRVLAASEPEAAVPFLVMERLHGSTLAEILRRKNQLPGDEVSALVSQVGAGLDAARAAGIVHRDLKPQNLVLDAGVWKILDFGVATLDEQGGTLTQGGIVGTPHYMPPEQTRGGRIDHRADLYSLGTVAYRALTGRNPFGGPDIPAILYAVVHTMPPRPSALAQLHADVDRWMALAIAKDPEARPGSGQLLATQLAAALRGELAEAQRTAADRLIDSAPWQELA